MKRIAKCGCTHHKDGEIMHVHSCWNEDQVYVEDDE